VSHHDPNAAVTDLSDRFWEGVLERDPITATIYGDTRYDDRWPDWGLRAGPKSAARCRLPWPRRRPCMPPSWTWNRSSPATC
jgi:hypothetical protein